MQKRGSVLRGFIPWVVGIFFFWALTAVALAEEQDGAFPNGDKKQGIEQQIQQLEKEAEALDVTLQDIFKESRTLANETKAIETEVKRRELEIKRLTLAIQKATLEIKNKSVGIVGLSKKIEDSRKVLASSIFLLYSYDQESILSVLIKNKSLSDFFLSLSHLKSVQDNIFRLLTGFKDNRVALEKEKDELEDFEKEQRELVALQEVERRLLAQKKRDKEELLRLTKGKEALFQQLLQSKKKDIAVLKTQLFYLERTGITAEDAVRFAELAAKRTGIRPAFLLALLEVETGKQFEEGIISVGSNVGTGNWKDDMYLCYQRLARYFRRSSYNVRAEKEKDAFFKITEELGLDPDKMPVSKEPPYTGCGGAMGPAQFIPTTWLLYENRVAELTGHHPSSPWNIDDAFTAAALFLADSGASSQTAAGEIRAAKTYLSGKPTCSSSVCRSYSNRILALARDIERTL